MTQWYRNGYYRYNPYGKLIENKLATEEKYKLKDFARWANKEGISNELLKAVVSEMNRGLLGDKLGAHICDL